MATYQTGGGGKRDQLERTTALARELAPLQQVTGQDVVLHTIPGALLSLDVEREHLLVVSRWLRERLGFELLCSISGVDLLDHLEVVYHLRSLSHRYLLQLCVRVEMQKPEVESLVSVWPGANWLEREVYDLFGIRFVGHPDLRRILLDDEFEGYPLLKSFQAMPPVIKDPATTQVNPDMAITGTFQTRGYEQGVGTKVSQGREERFHPGTPTFGPTQEMLEMQKYPQPVASQEGTPPEEPAGDLTEEYPN